DEHTSDNAFVAPGTIAGLMARGNHALGAPPEAMVLVSNRGGVVAGADATESVTSTLAAHLGSLKYTLNAAKVSVLERADRNGSQLAQIFSSLGTFGVLAGILLLVNIFFMLADERKSELGMLRAVGPVFIFVGIGPVLARHLKRAHAATLIAIAVLFWGVVAVPIALALQSSVSVFQFVAQGLMLVGAAVVLVTQQQHAIGHAVGRVANRSLHVRLGLAYPLARRFRTAMTLGMFALVVFILVYVSVIGAMFAGQLDQF